MVADALSRIYSNDSAGTVRAKSEHTYYDVVDDDTSSIDPLFEGLPVLAGIEARVATRRGSRDRRPTEKKAAMVAEEPVAESSKKFASRMKNPVVLNRPNAPVETTEGGYTGTKTKKMATRKPNTTHTKDVPAERTLINIVSQSMQGLDLLTELRGKHEVDPTLQAIMNKPNDFRNFEVDEGLAYLKKSDKKMLCIPNIVIQGRTAREIIISEAHSMLAHLGASKTLDYLRDHVWWRDMVSDVKAFCETCHTCKTSKPSNQKPYGLLNPLSVPSYPWESIGMDFVGPLPESGNRDGLFDSITVVICLLTSMVHLIPSRTNYNASQLAELMFEHVYKLHGLPKNIISDRDVLFTSTFWGQLHRLIGTKLRLSSAYHPQSDGSTERANRTITQMLRQCVHPNQKDWVAKLLAIEFAINSARSESTGFAPFFLNSGRMPRTMLWVSNSNDEFPSVRDFALQKKLAIMSAHDSILSARVKQIRDANRKRRAAPFKTGELVYLATKNISFAKGLARKLIPKYIGPYKILRAFDNSSFRLELPDHLRQRGVHDVFHASLLREHIPNDDRLFPGRTDAQLGETPDTEGEWAVEAILSHAGSGTDSVFEIKWKSGDITWLPYYQITHLQALTDYLDLLGTRNIRSLPKGAGQPPREDPQLFLGPISILSHPTPSPTTPVLDRLKDDQKIVQQNIPQLSTTYSTPSLNHTTNLTIDSLDTMPPHRGRSKLAGIDHPSFTRISTTAYAMREPNYPVHTKIHVGQISEYLRFDEQIRTHGESLKFRSVPIGFNEFGTVWNNGAIAAGDSRRISSVFLAEDAKFNFATPSLTPVHLEEFHITPEQAGVITNTAPDPKTTAIQADLNLELATILVARQKKQRQSYEERQQEKLRPFAARKTTTAPSSSRLSLRKRIHKHSKQLERVPAASSSTSVPSAEDLPPADDEDTEIPEENAPNTGSTEVIAPMDVAN